MSRRRRGTAIPPLQLGNRRGSSAAARESRMLIWQKVGAALELSLQSAFASKSPDVLRRYLVKICRNGDVAATANINNRVACPFTFPALGLGYDFAFDAIIRAKEGILLTISEVGRACLPKEFLHPRQAALYLAFERAIECQAGLIDRTPLYRGKDGRTPS